MGNFGGSIAYCVNKDSSTLYNVIQDENGEARQTGLDYEGQGVSTGNSLMPNAVEETDVHDRYQDLAGLHKIEHNPRKPTVRWEKIFPLPTLKVLLVEHDHSTRQVVGALLRNCSYQVVTTSNGLQAWKILEEKPDHVDLVLAEVNLPYLSGIGLLSKIMNDKNCKHIPMIMMSSHDSMGLVFKCLSKGAVDFLIKPIRKNELKNLWQHVWRRCHSSSGSWSESGIQIQRTSRSADESDDSIDDNDQGANGSTPLNDRDGSDKGSGTQSSWTRRSVEVDSQSSSDHTPEPCDSTCAQAIHSAPEIPGKENIEISEMGNNLDIGAPISKSCIEERVCTNQMSTNHDVSSNEGSVEGKECRKLLQKHWPDNDPSPNVSIGQQEIFEEENKDHCNNVEDKAKLSQKTNLPFLDAGPNRLRSIGNGSLLRQSDQSAFSRYSTTTSTTVSATGYCGSWVRVDHVASSPPQAYPHKVQNASDGYISKNVNAPSAAFLSSSLSACAMQTTPAFVPLPHCHTCSNVQKPIDTDNRTLDETTQPRGHHQVQHHHHYHHHSYHIHGMQPSPLPHSISHDNMYRGSITPAVQCGSSNVLGSNMDGNANYTQNASGSGSNHGSNGQNGSCTGMNYGPVNIDSDNGAAGKIEASGNGNHNSRSARREAALNKFRQKRKERCYEKKVRYHSRKRLAEQRPRIRGQFVRRCGNGFTDGDEQS